jgi:hypothetical protein
LFVAHGVSLVADVAGGWAARFFLLFTTHGPIDNAQQQNQGQTRFEENKPHAHALLLETILHLGDGFSDRL